MFYVLLYKSDAMLEAGINFTNELNHDILLHIGIRAKENKVVMNTRINNRWGKESNAPINGVNGAFRLDLDKKSACLQRDGQLLASLDLPCPIPETALDSIESWGPVQLFLSTNKDLPLQEVLFANGFEAALWLMAFDANNYQQLNPDLQGSFSSHAQALEHFLTIGIPELRLYSDAEIFDAGFYCQYYQDVTNLSAADAYRHWVKIGKQEGRSCSENLFLGSLGVNFSTLPAAFDAEAYRSVQPGDTVHLRTRWDAFKDWIESIDETDNNATPFMDSAESVQILTLLGDHFSKKRKRRSAEKLYLQALSFDHRCVYTIRALNHLGDLYYRSKHFLPAIIAYQRAIELGCRNEFVFIHLANALTQLGRHNRAIEVIKQACLAFPGSVSAQQTSRNIHIAAFNKARRIAIDFALLGDRSSAYQTSKESVIHYLQDIPATTAIESFKKTNKASVLIFGTADLAQCLHYRINQKMEHLQQAGYRVDFIPQSKPAKFMAKAIYYDIAIFYRVPALPEILEAMLYARQLGMTTFYEIDDLIFDPAYFPDHFDSYGGLLKPQEYANLIVDVPLLEQAMALCDYGIASTPSLQKIIAPRVISGQCFLHRNGFGQLHEQIAQSHPDTTRQTKTTVDIFYGSGTKAHNEDFDQFAAPAIAAVMQQHREVRLVIAGYLTLPNLLLPFEDRIICIPPIWDLSSYWTTIVAQADINIAVLKPGLMSDCKSEIKWLEAAMLGVPSLVSATATYREILTDGHTAMLAENEQQWQDKLFQLVRDVELRHSIGQHAWELCWQHYCIATQATNIDHIITQSQGAKPALPAKPLLLIVNVYFPPQTIGGATRVVRDNVDYFIDHYRDRFDLMVLTASEGEKKPYRLSSYDYRGIRVTKVSIPKRKRGNWQAYDERMETVFTKFLEYFQPQLIHFHCVQLLTASVVSATRKLGIPYYITAHDAWWLSDYQFLVDDAGKLRIDYSAIDMFKHGDKLAADAFIRRQQLKTELDGALSVLSVSESFENIYRQHGIENIQTVSNGVSHLPVIEKAPHPDHRIRLGLIGGMQAHKGLPLIKNALLSTEFKNLHLTLVDLSENYSQFALRDQYGSTPVDIIGKLPQEQIGELYSRLDVLLTLSIWPESYGLVSREALTAGLWVIASNRGAIGDDIVNGENGFVVDVEGSSALVQILQILDANPERYRQAPDYKARLRSADEQAQELAEIYFKTDNFRS